ncbi:hypothetical protein D3C71_881620 [compost metagenome]
MTSDLYNIFSTTVTSFGFVEALIYEGKEYSKRYVRDSSGYHGLDQAWEYEYSLPYDLVRALEDQDPMKIMSVLHELSQDLEGDSPEEDL